jgi:phage gpG-like protein
MADVTVDAKGVREFRRALRKLDRDSDRQLQRDLRQGGRPILEEARARAPRLTGELARSLRLSVTQRGISVFSSLPQAPVIHWGGTIRPRGVAITFPRTEFITRAVEDHADALIDDIGDGIEAAARRAGWK